MAQHLMLSVLFAVAALITAGLFIGSRLQSAPESVRKIARPFQWVGTFWHEIGHAAVEIIAGLPLKIPALLLVSLLGGGAIALVFGLVDTAMKHPDQLLLLIGLGTGGLAVAGIGIGIAVGLLAGAFRELLRWPTIRVEPEGEGETNYEPTLYSGFFGPLLLPADIAINVVNSFAGYAAPVLAGVAAFVLATGTVSSMALTVLTFAFIGVPLVILPLCRSWLTAAIAGSLLVIALIAAGTGLMPVWAATCGGVLLGGGICDYVNVIWGALRGRLDGNDFSLLAQQRRWLEVTFCVVGVVSLLVAMPYWVDLTTHIVNSFQQ